MALNKLQKTIVLSMLFSILFALHSSGQDTKYVLSDTAKAYIYKDSSKLLANQRKLPQAIDYAQKAIDIYSQTVGDTTPFVGIMYNNLGYLYRVQRKHEIAMQHYETARNLLIATHGRIHPNVGLVYNNIGIAYRIEGIYDKGLEYSLEGLKIYQAAYGEKDPRTTTPYNNIAIVYRKKGDYIKALQYLEEALDIVLKSNLKNDRELMFRNSIGAVHLERGDFSAALASFEKALDGAVKMFGREDRRPLIMIANIGVIHGNLRDFDKALAAFNEALNLNIKLLGEDHPSLSRYYDNIGSVYRNLEQYDKALEYYQKGLDLLLKRMDENNPELAAIYLNIGILYNHKKEKEKALEYVNKHIRLLSTNTGPEHDKLGIGYANKSTIYFDEKEYDLALENIDSSIYIFQKRFGDKHFKTAHSFHTKGAIFHKKGMYQDAFDYYQKGLKGRLFFYKDGHPDVISSYISLGDLLQDQGFDKEAISYYNLAVESIENLRKTSGSQLAKDFYQSKTNPAYEGIIQSLLNIGKKSGSYDFSQIFDYAEKSKANNLFRSLINANAKEIANIPESLLDEEHEINLELAALENQRLSDLEELKNENDTTILNINNKISVLKTDLNTLIEKFETDYPDYYKTKYSLSTVSLKTLQEQVLNNHKSLIEYVVGDSSLYIVLVNSDTILVHTESLDESLTEMVYQFRNSLTKYHTSENSPNTVLRQTTKQYVDYGQKLYQLLIAPVKDHIKSNLIIVPDNVLSYLPFELLLSTPPTKLNAFHDYPYLLKDHLVSYSYSSTLLHELVKSKPKKVASNMFLGMAPFSRSSTQSLVNPSNKFNISTQRNDSLNILKYSGQEVSAIAKLFSGDYYTGTKASKETFIKEANKYRIIHLSTHGVINDKVGDYTFLAFSDTETTTSFQKLLVRDIYNLSLNADLVVLSACNTGLGKIQEGEGVISLARAFKYAGAKSIVSSLWSVDDKSTSIVLNSFYQHLLNKKTKNQSEVKTKDQALRDAKLDFINSNKNLDAHPYFWGAFIGLGNMQPIQN